MSVRKFDPQLVVEGEFRSAPKGDIIVFSFPLMFWRVCCIVNVPGEGETRAPVYIKFTGGNEHEMKTLIQLRSSSEKVGT